MTEGDRRPASRWMYNARRPPGKAAGLRATAARAASDRAMNLILTHERGDFDAVGALLAARLLDPEARAVLPRRLNRNVRAFLTLYGDRLPLTTFDELPRERI